jgi:hypothetical protein
LSEEMGEVINRYAGKIHQFACKDAAATPLCRRAEWFSSRWAGPAAVLFGCSSSNGKQKREKLLTSPALGMRQ